MFNGVIDYIVWKFGADPIHIIYLIALLYLCLHYKKQKEFFVAIVGLALIFNDVSMQLIRGFKSGSYYRFFWMLLIPMVIGIAYISLIHGMEKRKTVIVSTIIFVGILTLEGMPNYRLTNNSVDLISNNFKEVVEIMEPDSVVLCAQSESMILRQYSAAYILAISDSNYRGIKKLRNEENYIETEQSYLSKPINYGEKVDEEYYYRLCEKNDIDYILLRNANEMANDMFSQSDRVNECYKNDSYTLYQFSK